MSSIFQGLVQSSTGLVNFSVETGAIPATAAEMRGLHINAVADAEGAFPIYASTGQLPASYGGGGLSWDANSRLRVTSTLPSALTRTNLLVANDPTDPANWITDAGVTVTAADDGWLRVSNLSAGTLIAASVGQVVLGLIDGKTFYGTYRVKNLDPRRNH